jgi:hypothetical protein
MAYWAPQLDAWGAVTLRTDTHKEARAHNPQIRVRHKLRRRALGSVQLLARCNLYIPARSSPGADLTGGRRHRGRAGRALPCVIITDPPTVRCRKVVRFLGYTDRRGNLPGGTAPDPKPNIRKLHPIRYCDDFMDRRWRQISPIAIPEIVSKLRVVLASQNLKRSENLL